MHTEYDFDTLIDRAPYASAKWARRTQAQKDAGAIPLSVADMEFRSPPEVVEAVMQAAGGVYGYTDADGAYFAAVVGWMARRHGWRVQPEWIVPENGVVPAMSVALRAFTAPGDGVLIQTPGYGPFTGMTEANGRRPVYSRLVLGDDGRYRMDLDDLRAKAADPRVTMMFLCSPHNPVGRVWTADELRAVADICREAGVLVVADEIHADLILMGKHTVFCQAAPDMADRCVVLTAPSKTFNLAGLQLANVIIPDPALREKYIARLGADGYGNASYFGYHAITTAYTQGERWLEALLAYVRGNFDFFGSWLAEHLPAIRLLPAEGTYLAWTDCRALGMTDEALGRFMREDALVLLNEGTNFGEGGEGFLRWNLAIPRAALRQTLERMLAAARVKGLC